MKKKVMADNEDGETPLPSNKPKISEPPASKSSALMSRLAHGAKAEVTKKDMLKLTNKNYELLPEVKKKREEDAKKEAAKQRL